MDRVSCGKAKVIPMDWVKVDDDLSIDLLTAKLKFTNLALPALLPYCQTVNVGQRIKISCSFREYRTSQYGIMKTLILDL